MGEDEERIAEMESLVDSLREERDELRSRVSDLEGRNEELATALRDVDALLYDGREAVKRVRP